MSKEILNKIESMDYFFKFCSLETLTSSSEEAMANPMLSTLIKHFMNIYAKILQFQKEKQFVDVDLVVGVNHVSVPAHRIILSASSAFFEEKNNSKIIELKEFDADIIENIVHFMYSSEIEIEMNKGSLKEAANFLGIKTISDACTHGFLSCELVNDDDDLEEVDADKAVFKSSEHFIQVTKKIITFYTEKQFFDIHLIVGDEKLGANRVILASLSDYFRAMFQNKMKEPQSSEMQIKDVDSATMRLLLDFMYTGSIQLSSETVLNILKAANFFQMQSLIAKCSEFLENELDPSNCLGISFYAEQNGHLELLKTSNEYACFLITKVRKEEEFLQLNEEQLTKFILSNELYAHLEDELFLGLAAWVEYKRSDREKYIPKLLSLICFKLLKPDFLQRNKHLLCPNNECEEEWTKLSSTKNAISRKVFKKIIFVGRYTGVCFKAAICDPESKTMSMLYWPAPKIDRILYKTIVVGTTLFIVGGKINYVTTNIVDCLDLKTLEWTSLPPMKHARSDFEIAELNGYLFVAGDHDTLSVEKFNISKREWEEVAPLPLSSIYLQLAVLDNKLYVGVEGLSYFQCYDPIENKWSQMPVRHSDIRSAAIVAFQGYLYAIGGYKEDEDGIFLADCSTVERYDPATNDWTEMASMAQKRGMVECVVWNDKLLAFLGFRYGIEEIAAIEEYTPESNLWRTLPYYVTSIDAQQENYSTKVLVVHLE